MKDYGKDATAIRQHLDNTINTQTYHMGDMAHLGGAAAFAEYLDMKHQGEAKAVKHELKRAVDYLFYYEMTKNSIYKRFAEDALLHVQELCEDIQDESEKEIASSLMADVAGALMVLCGQTMNGTGTVGTDGTITMPETAQATYKNPY